MTMGKRLRDTCYVSDFQDFDQVELFGVSKTLSQNSFLQATRKFPPLVHSPSHHKHHASTLILAKEGCAIAKNTSGKSPTDSCITAFHDWYSTEIGTKTETKKGSCWDVRIGSDNTGRCCTNTYS